METPEPNQPPKDAAPKLRIGRIEIGINVIIQLAVLLAMVVMVNSLSAKYYKRWNCVKRNHSDLSPMTRSLLENLQKPIKVIVFFSRMGEVEQDARALLREYEFAAAGKLSIEDVDPEVNFARARELQTKYKFDQKENIIILDYDGRSKFINSIEMAEMEEWDRMKDFEVQMRKRPPQQMLAFQGEQVLTNEILALTEPKQNRLYVVNGHGEFDTSGGKLRALMEYTRRQNLLLVNLTIADFEKIPDDANMVLVLGPKFDFSARDLKVLSDYWDKKGRILLSVGKTGGKTPNLFKWVEERGVRLMDDYVLHRINLTGIPEVESGGIVSGATSPITEGIEGLSVELLGATQSMRLNREKDFQLRYKLTGIMVSPRDYWGDTEFNVGDGADTALFDPQKDHSGALTLAVQVEKGASVDPNVKLETPRLVVVGNSDFVSDDGLRVAPTVINLASNCINWLLGRETLIKVPPKVKERMTLSLTLEQLNTIRVWVVIYLPLCIALLGIYYLSWRNQKNLFILTAWVAFTFLQLVLAWYLLLWKLGMEEAKIVPRNLIIAVGIAVSLGAISIVVNHYENQKRAAAKS